MYSRCRDERRQASELRRGEANASERVVHVRIKAGREEDQFGAELSEHSGDRGIHALVVDGSCEVVLRCSGVNVEVHGYVHLEAPAYAVLLLHHTVVGVENGIDEANGGEHNEEFEG